MLNLFSIPASGRKYIIDVFFPTLLSALPWDFMHFILLDTWLALLGLLPALTYKTHNISKHNWDLQFNHKTFQGSTN